MFLQCSTKWIRNFDTSKDEYGDFLFFIGHCDWYLKVPHRSILPDEYKNTFGNYGCEKSLKPPSSENKICEKFHDQIGQLRKDSNMEDFDENFVKEFLDRGPTESLLIPTDEIRFARFVDRPQF